MELIINLLPWIGGILGLIIGSFLNVVLLRTYKSQSLGGRSHCNSCGNTLSWWELIPVVSFLIQYGKCRSCKAKISLQYAMVELGTAGLFFLVVDRFTTEYFLLLSMTENILLIIALLIMVSYIMLIMVYDIQHTVVPLVWFLMMVTSSVILLILQYVFLDTAVTPFEMFIFHSSGMLVVIPFFLIWLISRGAYIGFADIEIIAWMGLFLGLEKGIVSVFFAFLLGSLFAIGYIMVKKIQGQKYQQIRKVQIPFTPFLLISFLIIWLVRIDIMSLWIQFIL